MNISNLAAITLAKQDELDLRSRGERYSEAVLLICDAWLNAYVPNERQHIEASLVKED